MSQPNSPSSDSSRDKLFAALIQAHERRLHGFIRSLVPETADVEDLYQQTSAVLWRRFDDYRPGTNFAAWAMLIARNQVRDFRKTRLRRRGVFSDDIFDALADKVAAASEAQDARQEALAACLSEMRADGRTLIQLRYAEGLEVEEIARRLNRSDKTIYRWLGQARQALLSCVRTKMAEGSEA